MESVSNEGEDIKSIEWVWFIQGYIIAGVVFSCSIQLFIAF